MNHILSEQFQYETRRKRMVIKIVKMALEKMDKNYCRLSQISKEIELKTEKYLERPFCYEFYHQLRKLIENGNVNFCGSVVQAEVDKRYQGYFENGKIPDFIFHVPDTQRNLAVVEFKLASRFNGIKDDFQKLLEIKKVLKYEYLIEVIIGNDGSLEEAKSFIKSLCTREGQQITVIAFDTKTWKAFDYNVRYSGTQH
jgi:hypothetical protein